MVTSLWFFAAERTMVDHQHQYSQQHTANEQSGRATVLAKG